AQGDGLPRRAGKVRDHALRLGDHPREGEPPRLNARQLQQAPRELLLIGGGSVGRRRRRGGDTVDAHGGLSSVPRGRRPEKPLTPARHAVHSRSIMSSALSSRLSPAQRSAFDEAGYLVLADYLRLDELEVLRSESDAAVADAAARL